MNLPERPLNQGASPPGSTAGGAATGGGPEFERVRSSLRQLKIESKEGQQLVRLRRGARARRRPPGARITPRRARPREQDCVR
eukprot:5869741-Prymnesium_polylepis.2